jgi:imidazolonepropionase-like amidohydrolase
MSVLPGLWDMHVHAMKVSDQVGTVTEGKYADIIAVRGDVLRHINLLQNVDIVIKHDKRWK